MTTRKFTHPDAAPEGQEYETECGYPVQIYSTDTGKNDYIHGAFWSEDDKRWKVAIWKASGLHKAGLYMSLRDKPRKIKGWVNVYPGGIVGTHAHKTKEAADRDASMLSERIACVPIEYTEGEGLE